MVGVLTAVRLTLGFEPVVAFVPELSTAQVDPAAAFTLATYTHIVTPLSFGTFTVND